MSGDGENWGEVRMSSEKRLDDTGVGGELSGSRGKDSGPLRPAELPNELHFFPPRSVVIITGSCTVRRLIHQDNFRWA